MERNVNNPNSLNTSANTSNKTHKFNSDLLNRPFSSKNDNYISNDTMNITGLSFSNYSDSLLISTDLGNNNIANSNHNNSNNNNQKDLSASQSSINSKKRKPFDKLTFSGANNNFFNCTNNVTAVSGNKTNEETELPNNQSHTNNNLVNDTNQNNPSSYNHNEQMNTTFISEKEKSFIKTQYRTLDKETLDKAILYNSQFKNSLPFWIKFFTEIENDNLHSNSSYYKVDDKDKFVANLVQMVKGDAGLYDVMMNHQKVKSEVKNNIKTLLITEIKGEEESVTETGEKTTEDNQSLEEHSKISAESSVSTQRKLSREDQKINNKLTELIAIYGKLDEREKKIIDQCTNFENYKNNLLNGGSGGNTLEERCNKKIKKVEEKLNTISENELKTESTDNNSQEKAYKLIDEFSLPEDDFTPIMDIELNALSKANYSRLLEIDRKLHQLNPEKYSTSINTSIKEIHKEFTENKEKRDKDFRDKMSELREKEIIVKDKKTIFDTKEENTEKVKYKDYLLENKKKKEKTNLMKKLDEDIYNIKDRPVDEEKRMQILKDCEEYHKTHCETEEYRQRINNVKGLFGDEEEKLREIEDRHLLQKKLIAELEDKFRFRDKIMEEKMDQWKEDFRQPYEELVKEIDIAYQDNKVMLTRVEELEHYILETEDKLNKIPSRVDKLKEEAKEYEKLWEEADKLHEPFDWGVDNLESIDSNREESLIDKARRILESDD